MPPARAAVLNCTEAHCRVQAPLSVDMSPVVTNDSQYLSMTVCRFQLPLDIESDCIFLLVAYILFFFHWLAKVK